jgi:hypothetical protein
MIQNSGSEFTVPQVAGIAQYNSFDKSWTNKRWGRENFLFSITCKMGSGDCVSRGGGVKCQRYESDHSPQSSAEFENGGAHLHSPIYLHSLMFN